MILERVRIESFAGLSDREVALGEGLNVVLGPNEAGKSTLFQAIFHILLTPASLSRPQFERLLGRFLPLGGGNSIACSLELLHLGQRYQLSKRWGEGRAAELALPDGSRLRGEEPLHAALAGLLPAGEGTLRTIFLAAQSALPRTLEELKDSPEATGSLADLLRRAALQPDGLSVSAFQEKLAARRKELLERWDLERGRPEANRGLDNPWKKGAGQVVLSWYEREELERRRREAEQAESRLGELGRALESCRAELAALERRLREQEPAAQSVWKRRSLEGGLENLRAAREGLKGDFARWPALEQSLERAVRELPAAQARVAGLEREKGLAEQAESRRRDRELLARARELERAAAAAAERLARLPALPRPALAELESAAAEAERAAAAWQAAGAGPGLAVSFQARADIRLQVSTDGEPARARELAPGETLSVRARERARLEGPDWNLEVSGGAEAGERRREQAEAARRRLDGLLSARGLPSLEAARQSCLDYELASGQAQEAAASLQNMLAGRSLEELQAAAPGPAVEQAPRELGAVLPELNEASNRLRELEKQEAAEREALLALQREHESREKLLDRIVAQTSGIRKEEDSLASLPALPPEAADPDAFLRAHEQDKVTLEELRRSEKLLDKEYGIAESGLPEESAEELAARQSEAGRRHQAALRQAQGLLAVQEAAAAVLARSGSGSQEHFERALARYAAELTAERYRAMPLENGLPGSLRRADGLLLPFELLSGGTRGLFALALRLAMADAYLGEGEGFLVLDDPLVDLDPARQERASAVLERFASRPGRQLLLFTCHPAHAARFPKARRSELS